MYLVGECDCKGRVGKCGEAVQMEIEEKMWTLERIFKSISSKKGLGTGKVEWCHELTNLCLKNSHWLA